MADISPTDFPDDVKARFWAKVERREPDQCWPWNAYRNVGGYGRLKINGRPHCASRLALQIALGRKLNKTENACHRCDNPPCCNPVHLFVGTQKKNMMDSSKKGRIHRWNGARAGEGNPASKLTQEKVLEILSLRGHLTQDMLAEKYGVSRATISNVMRQKNWRISDG